MRLEHRGGDGDWRPLLYDGTPLLAGELGNGLTLTSGPVENLVLEEGGPERAVLRFEVPIIDDGGIVHFRNTIRLHMYYRMPIVRLVHRLTVVSPTLADAYEGEDLAHLTPELAYLRDAVDGETGEAASLLRLRSLELRLSWHGSAAAGQRIVHEHDRGFAGASRPGWRRTRHEGRWPGFLSLGGANGDLALCFKHFWQTYPKAIRCDARGGGAFSALSGEPFLTTTSCGISSTSGTTRSRRAIG